MRHLHSRPVAAGSAIPPAPPLLECICVSLPGPKQVACCVSCRQGTKDDSADGDGSQASEDDDGTQLSFWGVASVLTATVKAKTTQVLTAVQETDWRAELEAFQQASTQDAVSAVSLLAMHALLWSSCP